MNYEQKYNEILEWARKNKARLNGVPIEEVLPELRESEDERIRKALVEFVHGAATVSNDIDGVSIHDCLAWLEKQKEQSLRDFIDDFPYSDQKDQNPADLSTMMVHKEPYIAPVPTPMIADEQKQEWSEKHIADIFEKVGLAKKCKHFKLKNSWADQAKQ